MLYFVVLAGFIVTAATIDLLQPEANLVTDSNGYIRMTSQTYASTGTSSNLNSAAVFKGAVNSSEYSLNVSFTDGLVLNGALTGVTNLTASGTITGEQLTSTDDATITDDLGVGGDATVTGTLGVTDDITATDDLTVGGWLTIPSTTVSAQSYSISATGKAGYYIVEYTDTGGATIFLPDTPADGTIIGIKDGDGNAGSNILAVQTAGGDTIEEAQVYSMTSNNKAAGFNYDAGNTDWSLMWDAN